MEASPFRLEQPKPQNDKPRTCGNCAFYEPHRDSVTQRVHPTKIGKCSWRLPEIEWPLAFRMFSFREDREETPRHPYSSGVWKDTDATTCKCFIEVRDGRRAS